MPFALEEGELSIHKDSGSLLGIAENFVPEYFQSS